MKKTVEQSVTFCDGCKKQTFVDACLKCGSEHCWECRRILGVEYKHSCFASGSGDGYYCNGCNDILLKTGSDLRFNAYRLISNLRYESKLFYDDWKKRCDEAEAKLKGVKP